MPQLIVSFDGKQYVMSDKLTIYFDGNVLKVDSPIWSLPKIVDNWPSLRLTPVVEPGAIPKDKPETSQPK